MPAITNDIRYALRVLRKERGFTLTAILTLALGIGAATTIFSVVNTVLIERLNYRDPDQLVLVRERIRKILPDPMAVPSPDVLEFQALTEVFEGAAGWLDRKWDLGDDTGRPARVEVALVTANTFPLLGASPALGRTFTAEEDRLRQSLAVLSHSLWRTRYASDPGILGRKILLNRVPHTVVGVMPASFVFPPQGLRTSEPAVIWVPRAFTARELESFGDNFDNNIVARARRGVSQQKVNAALAALAPRIQARYPAMSRNEFTLEALALPLREEIVGKVRTLVLLLAAAVLFLLLIACGNVANLMLSRAAAREREFAIRTAIGARKSRIVAQWLTESLILSAAGGLLGVLLAWYGTDALAGMTTLNLPRLAEVSLDLRVLGVSIGLSMLTGLLFGTAPAFFSAGGNLSQGLKEGGRGSAGIERHRFRSALVVSEVALALMLLIGAGLLVRSFFAVRAMDPGFRPENVVSLSLSLPPTTYKKSEDVARFIDELDRRFRALPGVMAVGAGTDLPLGGPSWQRLFSVDDNTVLQGQRPPTAFTVIFRDYFQTLGIGLVRGRLFTDEDRHQEAPVVIVSESMAGQLWPGKDPIGRRLQFGLGQWHTVVGVVRDVKERSLERASQLHTYVPASQAGRFEAEALRNMSWVVRSSQAPETLIAAARGVVRSLDAQMPVAKLETMEQALDATVSSRRLETYAVALFAGTALLLAAIGIYGVVSYSVTQRAQEIGIRMALGATAGGVVRMVLRQGLLLSLTGIAVGVALAAVLARYIGALLFGVKATDPSTYLIVCAILLATAVTASLLPARRAARVDPMVALRRE